MRYQIYNQLPLEAKQIREEVFIDEQGFQNEFDDIDNHCLHLVVYDDIAIGCARMYVDQDNIIFGRIAVKKEYRGKDIGSYILKALESEAGLRGYHHIELSAQTRAKEFYEKNGFHQKGDEYMDEFCPHICMYKDI